MITSLEDAPVGEKVSGQQAGPLDNVDNLIPEPEGITKSIESEAEIVFFMLA
jgi:hypothetical protein